MIRLKRRQLPFLLLALASPIAPHSAQADDGTWSYNGSASASYNWSLGSSWEGGTVGGGAGSRVLINPNINATRTIFVDGTTVTVGILDWGDSDGTNTLRLTGSNGGTFVFDNGGQNAQLNYLAGSSTNTWLAALPVSLNSNLVVTNNSSLTQAFAALISEGANGGKTLEFAGGAMSFTGTMSGANVLKVSGGTLAISGANTYSGGTVLAGGQLLIGGANVLGSGTLVIAGGTISTTNAANARTVSNAVVFDGNATLGDPVNTAALTLSGSGLLTGNRTFTVQSGVTISGPIGDGGGNFGITKEGAGILTLGGSNSYTGSTIIKSGTLLVSNSFALRNSRVEVNAEGVLSAANLATIEAGSLVGSGTVLMKRNTGAGITFSVGHDNTSTVFTGILTSDTNSILVKAGTGKLTLTADSNWNTASSATEILDGILEIGNGGTTGSIAGGVKLTGASGILSFNRSDDYLFSGLISGAGQVRKDGAGTLILTANNTFTGNTVVNSGTLQLGNGETTGAVGGNVEIAASTALVFDRSNNLTHAGVISGSGQVKKKGGGTLTLTGNNTYTGITTITGGTLQIGGNGAAGTTGALAGDVIVGDGSALAFSRFDTYTYEGIISGSGQVQQKNLGRTILTRNHTYSGGTVISAAGILQVGNGGTTGSILGDVSITFAGGALAFNRSDDVTFGGLISGVGQVRHEGTGKLIFTANNTYAGLTTISSSTVQLGNGGTTGSLGGNVSLSSASSTLVFDRSDDFTQSGAISGEGQVRQDGSGMVTLTGANNYNGGTFINSGTLRVGDGGTLGSLAGDVAVAASALFGIDRSDEYTFEGVISGSGGFSQLGSGTTTLTGNHAYTGVTTVQLGTLLLASSANNIASSSVINLVGGVLDVTNVSGGFSLAENQKLSGSGSVKGAITIGTGATLSAGNSIGIQTFDNDLTLADGSLSIFEVNGFGEGMYDLVLGGEGEQTVVFEAGSVLNIIFQSGFSTEGSVKIFDFENYSGLLGEFTYSGLAAGYLASFDSTTGTLTVIPEPGALSLLALCGGGMLFRRWRRRSAC